MIEKLKTAGLASLSSANFGMVMATGIIATASGIHGWGLLAKSLFFLNIGLYIVLWLLYAARFFACREAFAADFRDHLKGPPFFTAVAATAVLGTQFILQAAMPAQPPRFARWRSSFGCC